MLEKYELVYDYADDWVDEHNLREIVEVEDWHELQRMIKDMRREGYYNIDACYLGSC